jgi:hypothetical protein
MNHDEELMNYKKEILNQQIEMRKQQLRSQFWISFFAIITLIGFFVLIFSIRDATMTGFVVGEKEANLYGLMVLIIFLVIWGFLLFQWYLIHKNSEKI